MFLKPLQLIIAISSFASVYPLSTYAAATSIQSPLVIKSDFRCPYVCDLNSEKPGYMVEVIRAIFAKKGQPIELRTTNWARAVNEVRANKADALLGATKEDAPELVFPESPLGLAHRYFFIHKDANWRYSGRHSLQSRRVGVVNGHNYGQPISELINSKHKSVIAFSGSHPLQQILKMMESGRLDAFIEDPVILKQTLSKQEIESFLKSDGTKKISSSELNIAFSPKHPQAELFAKWMSQGVQELRQNGDLQEILDKYNLVDWE